MTGRTAISKKSRWSFIYKSGDEFYFMNLQTYEQIKLDAEAVATVPIICCPSRF
jgi:translation elongation factor P/translation initiation factor 5A